MHLASTVQITDRGQGWFWFDRFLYCKPSERNYLMYLTVEAGADEGKKTFYRGSKEIFDLACKNT